MGKVEAGAQPLRIIKTDEKLHTVVSVDMMGGDLGPAAIIAGLAKSVRKNSDIQFILHGPEDEIKRLADKSPELRNRCVFRDALQVVDMADKPSQVVRKARGTSMWSALESVKIGEATVAVSCGNTGALMALSMLRLRKQEGVNRPAIAVLWPSRSSHGFNVVLDVGADVRADAKDLVQYARMGTAYARYGLGIEQPRVGLLNVGAEENKGGPNLHNALIAMRATAEQDGFECVDYVEGDDIPGDKADVIVTDGFTGNIALKTGEGTASLIGDFLKKAFSFSLISRLASLLAYGSLQRLKQRIDPRQVNGGVFLGLNGTVVKSHGGADATGIAAAVKLAFQLAQSEFSENIKAQVAAPADFSQGSQWVGKR